MDAPLTRGEEVFVQLARMEAKLDMAIAHNHDHETRLRLLESRPAGITPKAFLATAVGMTTVLGSLVTLLFQITGK